MRQMDALLSAVRPPAEIKTSSRKLALEIGAALIKIRPLLLYGISKSATLWSKGGSNP